MTGAEVIQLAERITRDLQSVGIAGVVFIAEESGGVYLHLDIHVNGVQIGRVRSEREYETQRAAAARRAKAHCN